MLRHIKCVERCGCQRRDHDWTLSLGHPQHVKSSRVSGKAFKDAGPRRTISVSGCHFVPARVATPSSSVFGAVHSCGRMIAAGRRRVCLRHERASDGLIRIDPFILLHLAFDLVGPSPATHVNYRTAISRYCKSHFAIFKLALLRNLSLFWSKLSTIRTVVRLFLEPTVFEDLIGPQCHLCPA